MEDDDTEIRARPDSFTKVRTPSGVLNIDDEGATEVQIEPGWAELRHKLVAHYIQATARREVHWIA